MGGERIPSGLSCSGGERLIIIHKVLLFSLNVQFLRHTQPFVHKSRGSASLKLSLCVRKFVPNLFQHASRSESSAHPTPAPMRWVVILPTGQQIHHPVWTLRVNNSNSHSDEQEARERFGLSRAAPMTWESIVSLALYHYYQ